MISSGTKGHIITRDHSAFIKGLESKKRTLVMSAIEHSGSTQGSLGACLLAPTHTGIEKYISRAMRDSMEFKIKS